MSLVRERTDRSRNRSRRPNLWERTDLRERSRKFYGNDYANDLRERTDLRERFYFFVCSRMGTMVRSRRFGLRERLRERSVRSRTKLIPV